VALSNDRKALLFGLSAVLLWSTVATAFKLALRELDVWQLLAIATPVSLITLLVILFAQGRARQLLPELRAQPVRYLVLGLVNPLLYYQILLRAYDLLPAQQAQAINYTWAIMLALLAVPMLGQRLQWRDIVALLLGYGGVLIIATRGDPLSLQFDSLPGIGLALLSTVIWPLYWIMNRRHSVDPVVGLTLNFAVATPLALLGCWLFSEPPALAGVSVAASLYIGLFELGISFVLWATALRLSSGVSRVGNLIFLSLLLSLFFIQNILGESIHPATVVGMALIIPGILLQQSKSS
jgi:drug/metabolite transporter (DMT)-like permease